MNRDDFKGSNLTSLMSYGPTQGVTANVIIDLRRPKGEDIFPCKYRITYQQEQIYFPCMDLSVKQYDRLHGEVKNANLVKTKKLIQAGFKRITDTIEDILNKEAFSLELLKKKLSRGTQDSIFSAFDNKIAELENDGRVGTAVFYSGSRNSIMKYVNKDVMFSDITPQWLQNYESHLQAEGKELTTISINLRALRAIINDAKREGIITEAQYPFSRVRDDKKFQIKKAPGSPRALTEEQLYKVFDYPLLPNDEKWRDLWVFSFYCNGANIGDMLRFKYRDIVNNGIEWYRKKTISEDTEPRKIRAVITEEMQDIINKYGNPDRLPGNYIFPYLLSRLTPLEERKIIQNVIHSINKRMKKIGRTLGYGEITTYWCRHTWASISRRKEVKLYAISKGLGHKNLTTTQNYLDSLPDDELIENAAKMPRRNKK
jgi:integrase